MWLNRGNRAPFVHVCWSMHACCSWVDIWGGVGFDFIECFTTTCLRAHDDEDEVGLKEKPEDTRYIKKHRECGQRA